MVRLGEVVMIHDLKRQGLSISAIARKLGLDRKTVRKHLEGGVTAPVYGPRQPRPRLLEPYEPYLRERILGFPDLSGRRLLRDIRGMGYGGGYTAVTDYLRTVRPPKSTVFERRFETPAGRQAQVDLAQFRVEFTDEPGVTRIIWLFSMVLGHSRWLWGRFCAAQDLQTVMRCGPPPGRGRGDAPMSEILVRIRASLIGLRMPRALEALEHTMHQLERGEISALEAIDRLLSEEHITRESRRVTVALKTARLMPIKTLEGFDFAFQPSLDRGRILALAQLHFIGV